MGLTESGAIIEIVVEHRQIGRLRMRGFVLILVILVVLVLAILSRSTVLTASQQGFGALTYLAQTRSTLLAETANQIVLDRLADNPEFAEDFEKFELQSMEGSFSINFVDSGTRLVLPNQSVNNLMGTETVNGPRGELTVPPGTMDLVVEVESAGFQKRFESLIRSPRDPGVLPGIGSAGKIRMHGNVSVDGIQSPTSDQEIKGGIHSSLEDPALSEIIHWSKVNGGDRAEISGRVSTTSPSSTAIAMDGATILDGERTGVAAPPLRQPDIQQRISSKSGASTLVVPLSGSLSVGNGEHYVNNDVNIAGDLVLNDSDVYIKGNLEVNGSIRGTGTVWVGGDTHFRGDSSIQVGGEDKISLQSRGNVVLEGFGGLDYLKDFVAAQGDSELALDLSDTKDALEAIQAAVKSSSASDLNLSGSTDNATQPWRRVLAEPNPHFDPPPGYQTDTLTQLAQALRANGSGETNAFMIERLETIQRFNRESSSNGGDAPQRSREILAKWEQNDLTDSAYLDYLTEYSLRTGESLPPGILEELLNYLKQLSFDKLGTSSFQGTVITDGAFVAKHEVIVIGQIIATGNNKDSELLTATDGSSVGPGDVFIGDGCHVTYCQEYVEDADTRIGSSRWEIGVWIE